MRRHLRVDPDGLGALDPDAIAEVVAQARPPMRDPDELHDALLSRVYRVPGPEDAALRPAFAALVERRRAVLAWWPGPGMPSDATPDAIDEMRREAGARRDDVSLSTGGGGGARTAAGSASASSSSAPSASASAAAAGLTAFGCAR